MVSLLTSQFNLHQAKKHGYPPNPKEINEYTGAERRLEPSSEGFIIQIADIRYMRAQLFE
jgi:hypothetical protein